MDAELERRIEDGFDEAMDELRGRSPATAQQLADVRSRYERVVAQEERWNESADLPPPIGTPVTVWPNALFASDEPVLTRVLSHHRTEWRPRTSCATDDAPYGCFYSYQFWQEEDGSWSMLLL